MTTSVLTKKQTRTFGPRSIRYYGERAFMTVTIRYDDECGNGHNTFAITAVIEGKLDRRKRDNEIAGGMLHDEIRKHFPELTPFLKWHLCSSDEPMHYIANTLYWLGFTEWNGTDPNSPPNIEHARSTAVWPEMPESFLCDPDAGATINLYHKQEVIAALEARRQELKDGLKAAVESLGMVY